MADPQAMPPPDDEGTLARWEHTRTRRLMLKGNWGDAAEQRLQAFFAPEAMTTLPPAELSYNPFLSVVTQISSLYDEEGAVEADGASDDDLDMVVSPVWWSQQQQTLEWTVGLNDCFVLTLFDNLRGFYYQTVTPDVVEVEPDPRTPDQPGRFVWYDEQRRPGADDVVEWTRTTWDILPTLSTPLGPAVYRVEAYVEQGDAHWEDVTAIYQPALEGRYPLVDRAGDPIMPAVAYHRKLWAQLLSPLPGRELVEGTLTTSTLMTHWVGGVRDGAHPLRYALDAEVSAGVTTTQHASGNRPGVRVVRADRTSIMQFRSLGDGTGSLGQWNPTMDPKSAGEAIAAYSAQLAVYAGVSPSDVSVKGSSGQSGYAISISRDGQRRARRKLIPPMRRSDELLFATAARVLNGMGATTTLPEDAGDWMVRYAELPRSLEEVKADLEEADRLRAAGVLGLVDYFLRFNSGLTREQAIEKMLENAREEREIEVALQALNATEEGADDE